MQKNAIIKTLVILALSMQIMGQHIPALLTQAGGTTIQICSGADIRTITIDENGNEIPSAPTMPNKHCSFCLAASDNNDVCFTQPAEAFAALDSYKTERLSDSFTTAQKIIRKANLSRGPPVLS